jgi:hypothetical protein
MESGAQDPFLECLHRNIRARLMWNQRGVIVPAREGVSGVVEFSPRNR